jgi:ABC-type amino acid transport substrate-binding protein
MGNLWRISKGSSDRIVSGASAKNAPWSSLAALGDALDRRYTTKHQNLDGPEGNQMRKVRLTLVGVLSASTLTALSLTVGVAVNAATPSLASCKTTIGAQEFAKGKLTVATDNPVYTPWFVNNKPSNGKGYESAVVYAVANVLGIKKSGVKWAYEPFNSSYAPGPKSFDFDINEVSDTAARAQVVTFSTSYYDVQQSIDTPTGQYMASAQIVNSKKKLVATQVGQFPSVGEHYGLLLTKNNPIVGCINAAISALKSNGTLASLQKKWLGIYTSVPTIRP